MIVNMLFDVMLVLGFGVFDHAGAGGVVDAGQRSANVAEHVEIGLLRAVDAGEVHHGRRGDLVAALEDDHRVAGGAVVDAVIVTLPGMAMARRSSPGRRCRD